jgi:hypothetical protein
MEHETDRDEAARPLTGSASPQEASQADPGLVGPEADGRPEPDPQAAGDLAGRPEPDPQAAGDLAGRPEPDPQAAGDLAGPPPGAEAAARPATGEPRVDAALRLLDRLPGLPVSDHPELFEHVHAQLTDVLGELDSGSAGPADVHGS